MRPRRTARVLVFDFAGRVLLIRCIAMRSDGEFRFWLTPGGEIEPDEDPLVAAGREIREELGIELDLRGPVYIEHNQFEHHREMRDNTDFVFVAHCPADAPRMQGVTADEIAMMQEIRWWSAEEIEAGFGRGENIFPSDLVARMREFSGI